MYVLTVNIPISEITPDRPASFITFKRADSFLRKIRFLIRRSKAKKKNVLHSALAC